MSVLVPPLAIDYSLAAGANRIGGQSAVTTFGYISNAGGAISDVNFWQPQVRWELPTSPVSIEYSSTSASDGVAGTGARKILVIGVGPAFVLQIETVTMNGATPVASANTWMAINTMVVFDDATSGFGSNRKNVGDISAKIPVTGTIHGFITAGFGVSQHARYTVPAGFTWLVNNFFITGNKSSSPSASFSMYAAFYTGNGLEIRGLPLTLQNGQNLAITLPNVPVVVLEKQTLMFRILSVSTAGLDLSVGCTGLQTAN